LRNAVYRSLIAAHNALDDAEGRVGPRVLLEVGDFNLDARQEVRLENDRLIAWVRPARGGHIYELDVREHAINVLATLDRRPEAYHAAGVGATTRGPDGSPLDAGAGGSSARGTVTQPGRDHHWVYDAFPRKALVDHFFPVDVTLGDLLAGCERELGDFALGTYLAKVQREPQRVSLVMERQGRAVEQSIRLRKTIELSAGTAELSVHYELEDLPAGICVHFGVEINLAAMAGHAPDRYYADPAGTKLGLLDDCLDLPHTRGLALKDEWLDLAISFSWSQSAALWCFPIKTLSQSEGAIEGVYQSSAVIPHWHVTTDERGYWDVWFRWRLDRTAAVNAPHERSSCVVDVESS
jgi:alpha-amylase